MNILLITLTAIAAGVTTYFIANNLKKGAVLASASVTLASGIIFPYFFPTMGSTLMVVAACASYGGMVSRKNAPAILDMVMISAIIGLLFSITATSYAGIGGRLGTIAAISCFAWLGVKNSVKAASRARKSDFLSKSVGIWQ